MQLFSQYLHEGYFPFCQEDHYNLRLQGIIKQTIEVDIPVFAKMEIASVQKLRKLIYGCSVLYIRLKIRISLLTFPRLLHLIGKGTTCNGTIFVTELSKQQYYAEDDNYRHDDAYGNQFERAATG